ncbi:MAG: beta strand repeat-containing protein, partial [Terriglobales bacterium]
DSTSPKANDDIFLLKLSADGSTAELAVFIGGTGTETSAGVALDGSGNPYIAGGTAKTGSAATDFPMLSGASGFSPPQNTNAGSTDVFLAGLDGSTGNLTYTTFLGGTAADVANGLYFQGHYVFLTGTTKSSAFPAPGGFHTSLSTAGNTDAFAAVVIPADLSISAISCTASDVATVTTSVNHGLSTGDLVDVQGTAAGASATDFTQHAVPVAITVTAANKFTYQMTSSKCKGGPSGDSAGAGGIVTGQQQYGAYLGGSAGVSSGTAIVASALSNFYVVGNTADDRSGGTKFPNNGTPAQSANGGGTTDGFVTRFDGTKSGGTSEVASTFFGGSGQDSVQAVTLGPSNNVYVTGSTTSTASNTWLCGSSNAHCTLQTAAGSTTDAFVAKFAANLGSVTWGTFVGGGGDDAGYGIQVDSNSNVYVAGSTHSNNIFSAVSAGNVLGSYSAGSDAFLAVIAGGGGTTQSWAHGAYFGGAGDEGANTSLAFGPSGTVFLAGTTNSSDFWTSNTATGYQPTWPVASGSTSSAGFAIRIGAVVPTTTTVSATETISNQTNGQAANSTVLADTGSSHSSALYSYTICNGTFVSNTCTAGAATASDVRFNWPVPRFGSSVVNLVVNGGTGYTVAPTVTIDPPTAPGTMATASVSLSAGHVVLTLTNPGSGYSTVPNVNISGGDGTGASATAVLGPAPALFTTATSATGITCVDAPGFGVSCNTGTLAAGSTAQVNITATTTSAANISTGTIPVTARPTSGAANAGFPTVASAALTIVPSLDLQVAVTQPSDAHVGTVAAPNSVTFTITATNAGPGSTNNVTVDTSLLLNAVVMTTGFTLDATTPVTLSDGTNWSFSTSNGHVLVTSNNGYNWPAATPLTITIKGAFDPTVGFGNSGITPVSAKATISTSNTSAIDVSPGNNTDSKNFNILRDSDLTAATTDNTSTAIRLSDNLVLTTDATNNGTDDATNVAVAYTFAGGTVPASRNFTGFDTCSAAANVITCSFNTLAVGGGNKKTGVLTVTPPASGWPLGASVTTGTMTTAVAVASVDVNDTTPGNNSQNVVSNLARSADLQVTALTDNSATTPVAIAGPLTLTSQIKNAGPDDATNVIVHFTLTDGGNNAYTLGTNSFPSNCSAATNVVTCTVGTLTNGTTASYSVQVLPDANWVPATSNVGSISTVADVSSADVLDDGTAGAPGANNTSSSLTNNLARTSDLQVTTFTDNSQVTPVSQSGTLTFTSNLKNAGPDDAIDAVVTFTISGTAATAYTLGTTTFPSGCAQAGLVITCTVGPIAKNATPSYTVNLTPDPAWVGASVKTGTISSVAQISSPHVYDNGTSGAAGANNSSGSLTSNIARKADLRTTAVTDNTGVTPVNLTGTLVITPTIANFGPDDANGNIVVKITLPTSGYTINNGLTTFNGGCVKDATPTIVDCTVNGTLANAANLSYNLAVTPDAAWLSTTAPTGTISPSVQVSSSSVYDNGASGAPGTNNTNATLVTNLQRHTDLQLTNLTDNSTINPVPLAAPPVGPGLKYVTSIKNAGPDTAEGVKVVYTLPSAAYTFSSTTLGTCSQVTTTLTCTIGQLTTAAGTVNFTVTVAPDLTAISTSANPPTASVNTSAQVISTAVLDDGTAGAPGSNNNGSVNSALERQSDLKIGTMTDNSPVSITGTLTITTPIQNLGPDTAPNT